MLLTESLENHLHFLQHENNIYKNYLIFALSHNLSYEKNHKKFLNNFIQYNILLNEITNAIGNKKWMYNNKTRKIEVMDE